MQRALVIAILVVGCGKPAGQAAPPPAGGRDAAPADAPVRALVDAGIDAATAFAPRAATPDELAAAQAFVDRWLATQNAGDFAGYQALYADRFRGVRRTGRAVRRFDRPGWLADRKAMFRRPTVVAADHVVVYVAGPERQVFFTQTWSQGRFKDVGTKNLILEGTGAATKIRYEELLGSRVVPATPPPAVASGGDTWFGYDRAATLATMRVAAIADGRARLAGTTRALPIIDAEVLDEIPDPAAGGFGAGRVIGELAADDPLRAVVGQPVVVLDLRLGEACRGTIADVAVEAAGYVRSAPTTEAALGAALWSAGR
ncbi:MAG: nuclear transport factor 2 family protein [Myxococcales bacterium]|nr:nuclear transport factor 2 family protein [Myxococcales bacterium]